MAKKRTTQPKTAAIGYLPCFSQHLDSKYPIADFYRNKTFINKVANFMANIVTAEDMRQLKECAVAKDIMKIRPDSSESKKIIQDCGFAEGELYRADWGNCPYRLVFGLDTKDRRCYIFMLDANHSTYSGKNRK